MRDSRERDIITPASFRSEPTAALCRERRRTRAARTRETREPDDDRGAARIRSEIVSALPQLRALAHSLCGDFDRADDLVQEAVARALNRISLFEEGTNLVGWVFTILRNYYYSDYHKRKREKEDPEGRHAAALVDAPPQEDRIELLYLMRALQRLPAEQREALALVAIGGLSYEEAAANLRCPVGTVRSRINRARGEIARESGVLPARDRKDD